jgi:2-oxoglutarate dehydrogenase E2 component (dihydrolipoamide succinyltransferase)
MSAEVKIPAVGESITSGVLSVWHKQDGDSVQAGEPILTLDTDKVSSEITAEKSGTLRIKVPAGQEVKIGEVVGTIEEGAASAATQAPSETPAPVAAAPASAEPAAAPLASPPAPTPAPGHTSEAIPVAPSTPPPPKAPAPAFEFKPSTLPSAPPAAPVTEGRTTRRRLSPIRRKIAAQLVSAQQTAAILTTFNECDMSAVMALRKDLQEAFVKEHGLKLGFMSFFVKAVVSALKAVPSINSRLEGEEQIQNHYFDIGVAVGTEKGLVVPVIRDAEAKSFAQIEQDILDYAVKAREGKIKLEDLQGGVFTISNGGVYGSLLSTPILNPPQSGILGMHKIQERPVAEKGQVVIRPMMYLALSYDHRVVDGKEAVTFLIRVKDSIEAPARLLLGV